MCGFVEYKGCIEGEERKVYKRWMGMVFLFKQKTAYEMLRSLVGSEMCIRDSLLPLE